MAAIAAGRWVVTRRFIEKSHKNGSWQQSPHSYAFPREAVIESRMNYHNFGAHGGLFFGVKAVTVMVDQRKREVYR